MLEAHAILEGPPLNARQYRNADVANLFADLNGAIRSGEGLHVPYQCLEQHVEMPRAAGERV